MRLRLRGESDPTALDAPCRACGETVRARYEDGKLLVECNDGHLNHSDYLPGSLIEERPLPEATALATYTRDELERVLYAAAELHDCDVTLCVISESPCVDGHPALREVVGNVAWDVDGVDSVIPIEEFGVSEDGTYLLRQVQDAGGVASYLIVGTDHPTSHHTPTFDVEFNVEPVGQIDVAEVVSKLEDDEFAEKLTAIASRSRSRNHSFARATRRSIGPCADR